MLILLIISVNVLIIVISFNIWLFIRQYDLFKAIAKKFLKQDEERKEDRNRLRKLEEKVFMD